MSNPARRICLRVLDSIGGSGLAVIRSLENFYGVHLEINGEDVSLTENAFQQIEDEGYGTSACIVDQIQKKKWKAALLRKI